MPLRQLAVMTAWVSSEEKGVESIQTQSLRWRSDCFRRPQSVQALTASLLASMAALFQVSKIEMFVSSLYVSRDALQPSACE